MKWVGVDMATGPELTIWETLSPEWSKPKTLIRAEHLRKQIKLVPTSQTKDGEDE
ncbi:hypothetical protein GWO43_30235 [candidate division KSB1 bacterium]|nr:hypothetical protein [candidate division KSB1 bacterium]NIV70637.1 hypothetical protein [Phycisphaerae bacterium]NIS28170.1 hypothetical protein [candidate division KSB1 bacterium]NIT75062.1 hypothetical protein [candidate division KSB1 bacterium]NIU28848.1 hypothetical protein [candidate division KSB1 bacterium]